MNYQDSSSDDVPYLPPQQYKNYQEQQRANRLSQEEPGPSTSTSAADQRRGRSYFTEDELRELDTPSEASGENGSTTTVATVANANSTQLPTESQIPRPVSGAGSGSGSGDYAILAVPVPTSQTQMRLPRIDTDGSFDQNDSSNSKPKISWGRRLLGILLITIPAVLFSAAVHFIDWSMSDFQLFSASFFIFQGVLWPCLGIWIADRFCVPKNRSSSSSTVQKVQPQNNSGSRKKWVLVLEVFVHANLAATAVILQLLSIQRLNISISLALSFGFDVIVILIRYILDTGRCSLELVLLMIVSFCGYIVSAMPAFVASSHGRREDTAVGVGASVGVMVLSVAATLLLSHLRKNQIRDSTLGTTFAFFGFLQSLITKEIMGHELNMQLTGKAVGWAAGLISVVFLGTIFLFLESRLSGLIWKRDEEESESDRCCEGSTLTRTRVAVFILSCLWELGRQGFRDTKPEPYDIFGGFLVVLAFLLAGGFKAWYTSNEEESHHHNLQQSFTDSNEQRDRKQQRFFAFVPWLFAQKLGRRKDKM